MPPRDVAVVGPRKLVDADVPALNQVFADAFTDRYRRDGLVGVRVPRLNPLVWKYALRDSGDGAMVWTDGDDQIVAFNIAHCSGTEGWMGPLAVRSDVQGTGFGRSIVQAAVDWLQARNVRTIGLETMPRTVDNIGFYAHLGFVPGYLTVTLVGDSRRSDPAHHAQLLSELRQDRRAALIQRCGDLVREVAGGYDYSEELRLTSDHQLGDAVVIEGGGGSIEGFALWHSVPLVEAKPAEEVRLLKLYAADPSVFVDLIAHVERAAHAGGLSRVAIRCQSRHQSAFTSLVERGYRVRWTDLRMTLEGFPAVELQGGAILFSNWEI